MHGMTSGTHAHHQGSDDAPQEGPPYRAQMRTSPSLLTRVQASLRGWWRAITTFAQARAETRRLGMTSRARVGNQAAASQLHLMAESPAVYAALWHRCIGLQVYPMTVLLVTPGGESRETINPLREPWAASLLRLLQRPDPADVGRVFPRTPGELFLAELLADLLVTGTAYVRFQQGDGGRIVGLARLHPAVTTTEVERGQRRFRYRPSPGDEQLFRDEEVCVLRALSWASDLRSEQGVGAAEPLMAITRAEVAALKRTATAIEQGGVDIAVEPTSEIGSNLLQDPAQRKELADEITTALGKEGQRVFIPGGPYKLTDFGLKPGDLRGAETQAAARSAQLMALGLVPVMAGVDPGGYATAVAQLRVQYGLDLELVTWLEVFILRPLAQAFAEREGGNGWLGRTSQVTCAYNLSKHPGALAAETEAIGRAKDLMLMGWSNVQAAQHQGLDLPPPEGEVLLGKAASPGLMPSEQAPAQLGGTPRAPLGAEAGRTLGELLAVARVAPMDGPDPEPSAAEKLELERSSLWRAVEEDREPADRSLSAAAQAVLDREQDRYAAEVDQLLRAAWDGESYRPIAWGQVSAADPNVYVDGIGAPWLTTWEDAAQNALPDDVGAPQVSSSPDTLTAFQPSAEVMARTTRAQVLIEAQAAVADGLPPDQAVERVRSAWAFSPDRALTIGWTETVRAQSEGTDSRFKAAEAAGIALEQEWLSARDDSTRDSHRAIDGQRVAVGELFLFPSGIQTRGPGLSGVPGEDIHCRCAVRAVLK